MQADGEKKAFRISPILFAILLAYPAMQPQRAHAEAIPPRTPQDNTKDNLPDLGSPNERNSTVNARPNGVTLESTFDQKKVVVAPEYSNQTGLSIGAALASMLGDNAAVGVVLAAGSDKKELLLNAGFNLDERQRFIVSVGQLEQFLDYAFRSGAEKVGMTQNSGGVSYQLQLGKEFLQFLEINGYVAETDSRELAGKTFAIDTATLYELWSDPRRIAGGKITGLQGRLGFSPLEGSVVKVSLGQERLSYDLLTGKDSVNRLTGGAEWLQQLGSGYNFKVAADASSSQNRYTLGLERSLPGNHHLGVSLIGLRGRDGLGDDNQISLIYSYAFGTGSGRSAAMPINSTAPNSAANRMPGQATSRAGSNLLDQVAARPSFIPSHVVAKVDTTAAPVRLIAVDKTALPAGSSVNPTTGAVTTPLGVAVTGILGVTINGAPFANSGQFSLSGNSLAIDPNKITQPAVGVVDTYVVTLNNAGGGTTLVTVLVSHGSVKIDSITLANGDTAAPTTTAAPAVSGTTDTATTLSAAIDENGTGYYLVQAFAAAAPNVAAVQAGTSFAMTANVAATPAISGLAASTAYKIYFVAKDAANNVQAAVQSVDVTTTATPDTTAPSTTAGPSVSGTTDTGTTLSATINENGTGYYLVQAAAAAAPSVAAAQAGTSFVMTANVAATPAIGGLTASTAYKIYFVAKDAANNVQAAVQSVAVTTTATPDVTAPVATPDNTSTPFNTARTGIDVLANDTDSSGSAPTFTGVLTNMVGGAFTINAGKIDFTPTMGFSGAASVSYEITDGSNKSAGVLTVTVGVDPFAPVATPDNTTTPFNTAKAGIDVLANDTDFSGVAPILTGVLTNPVGGTFTVNAGKIDFTPTPGFSGAASVSYEINDADGSNNKATGILTVTVGADPTPAPPPADTTAPTTSAGPSVSGTTDTATTLTATINENGTGYYLVQAFAAAAPSVAAVQAGTSFVMTANVAATPAITGLVASTAYKIYFVTKDAVNNVQTAVQSVAVTTTATVDVTAPTTSAGPSVSGTTDTGTTLSATINENGTSYYLVQAFAAAAPSVAAVQAGTSFAMTANVAATPAVSGLTAATAYKIYFVAKDMANNVQAAVQSVAVTTAAVDTIPNAFVFVDQTNSALSTLTASAAITVAGINAAAAISVATGEYQINGGAWTAVAGTAANGDTVVVRHTTSASISTAVNTTLTIGGVSDVFTTTTVADSIAPTTPATLVLTGSAGSTAGYTKTTSVSINVADVTDPSGVQWFVSESANGVAATLPVAGDAGWSSTKPTNFTLSGTAGSRDITVYVKDLAAPTNNVQSVGKISTIILDEATPTTTAGPSVYEVIECYNPAALA